MFRLWKQEHYKGLVTAEVIERAFKKNQILEFSSTGCRAIAHVRYCALLGVLEEFTGFLVLCLVGRMVRREAEILPVPI